MAFERRFSYNPGLQVLSEIEGAVIIDLTPPGAAQGTGTGVVGIIAEFEDCTYAVKQNPSTGAFVPTAQPVEVFSAQDQINKLGGFDPTLGDFGGDFGNGFVGVRSKQYTRLIACPVNLASEYGLRVSRQLPSNKSLTLATPDVPMSAAVVPAGTTFIDSSGNQVNTAGPVQFANTPAYASGLDGQMLTATSATEQVFISAGADFSAAGLDVQDGDILVLGVVGASGALGSNARTCRVIAANAGATSGQAIGGAGPFNLLPGQTLVFAVDTSNDFAATFEGTQGYVQGSAGTFSALNTTTIEVSLNGGPTQLITFDGTCTSAATTAAFIAARLIGGTAEVNTSQVRILSGTAGTGSTVNIISANAAAGFAATGLGTAGTGDAVNLASTQAAEVVTKLNGLSTPDFLAAIVGGVLTISSLSTGPTSNVQVSNTSTATGYLGFDNNLHSGTNTGTGGLLVETMDGSAFTTAAWSNMPWRLHAGNTADSYGTGFSIQDGFQTTCNVPARPLNANIAADSILQPLAPAAPESATVSWTPFSGLEATTLAEVVYTAETQAANPATTSEMEALYTNALDAFLSTQSPVGDVEILFTSRTSAVIRGYALETALTRSQNGGGMDYLESPNLTVTDLNTVLQTDDPGVGGIGGAARNERLIYCWPGFQQFIPEAAAVSIKCADGSYTTTGTLDLPFNCQVASVLSELAPYLNPGQAAEPVPTVMANVLNYQRGAPMLGMAEYIALKAGGVCALNMDPDVGPIIQSGITTSLIPGQTNINRRRMDDEITQSLAAISKPFAKQPITTPWKDNQVSLYDDYLDGLLSPNNPDAAQIADYSIDDVSGNTQNAEAAGVFIIIVQVQMLATGDVIGFQASIGPTVQITPLTA